MPATSPYSGNDYQAVSNFRPYELPVNDIFKAISAQNQFWDAGAARVKSYYDKGLNLDLTLEENRKIRDQFMKDAEKEMIKLSTMDLADPSVQRKGMSIMSPLFKDKAILYDDQLTRVKKQIFSEADSYRTKKLTPNGIEGEGFSQKNLAYALDGFEEFNEKTARDENVLKGLYGKLANKKYIPQYDMTREFTKIINNCKGSSEFKQDVADGNYLYFDVSSKEGATSSEMTNCFMMGMSPMAKQQLSIDGWAYYKSSSNPYTDLANDHYNMKVGPYKERKEAIEATIKGIEDKAVKTDEDKKNIANLKKVLDAAASDYNEAEIEFKNMTSDNGLEYAKSNFQSLAGSIYMNRFLKNVGETYKNDNVTRKLIPNAAGIAQFNAHERERLMYIQDNLETNRIMLKAKLDYELEVAKGNAGITPLPLNPRVAPGEDNVTFTPEMQMEEEGLAWNEYSKAYETIREYIAQKIDPTKPVTHTQILNYANSVAKDNPEFNQLLDVYNKSKEAYEEKVLFRKGVEEKIKLSNKEAYQKLSNEKITLADGTVVSGADIADGMKEYKATTASTAFGGKETKRDNQKVWYHTFTFVAPNGKKYNISSNVLLSGDKRKIYDLFRKYQDYVSDNRKSLNEAYSKKWYEANKFYTPNFNIEKNITLRNYIASVTGLGDAPGGKDGYRVFGMDKNATSIYVNPTDSEGRDINSKSVIESLVKRAQGRSGSVDVGIQRIGSGEYAIRLTPRAPGVIPALPNMPTQQQQKDIEKLRNFQTHMEGLLKGNYASSEDLKDGTGNPYSIRNVVLTAPNGLKIKVHAQLANGKVSLIPSYENKEGGWTPNNRSHSDPEELILRLGDFYGQPQSQNLFNLR